jgi:hypothetical protein
MAQREQRRYPLLHRAAGEVPVITGPEERAAGHGRLRASHTDREHVIDTLKTAFADGRLDKDELDDRVGRTLAARTYAELATAAAGIPAGPARAVPPHRAARPPVNKETVKWGLVATGALIPPAMFVTAAFGEFSPLAFVAMPLLFVELIVVITFVTATLARQRKDRLRASRDRLPPRPGQPARGAEAERHGSTGHKPSPHGTLSEFAPPQAPPGMYFDPASELLLPHGVRLASRRRVAAAWVLGLALFSVTLGIGYITWSLFAWRQGRSPAQRILSLRCWLPEARQVAGREETALRQITGFCLNGQALSGFFIWLTGKSLRSVGDFFAGTVILHDPDGILGLSSAVRSGQSAGCQRRNVAPWSSTHSASSPYGLRSGSSAWPPAARTRSTAAAMSSTR